MRTRRDAASPLVANDPITTYSVASASRRRSMCASVSGVAAAPSSRTARVVRSAGTTRSWPSPASSVVNISTIAVDNHASSWRCDRLVKPATATDGRTAVCAREHHRLQGRRCRRLRTITAVMAMAISTAAATPIAEPCRRSNCEAR